MPITIPITFYSLEDARNVMEDRSRHPYRVASIRKAIREGKLKCYKVDRATVITSEAIEEYLREHGKFTRGKEKRRKGPGGR